MLMFNDIASFVILKMFYRQCSLSGLQQTKSYFVIEIKIQKFQKYEFLKYQKHMSKNYYKVIYWQRVARFEPTLLMNAP